MSRFPLAAIAACVCALVLSGHSRLSAEDKATPGVDLSAEVNANNEFAFDLYRRLVKGREIDDNIVLSPFSIRAAGAMAYTGSRGETAKQFAKVFRFDRDMERFGSLNSAALRTVRDIGRGTKNEIEIANAVWVSTTFRIRHAYRDTMARHYEAEIRSIDFRDESRAQQIINEWAAT